MAPFDPREALNDPGFTPGRKHLRPLLELLSERDDLLVERVERVLARGGDEAARAAMARIADAVAPMRGRLVRVVDSVCATLPKPEYRDFLRERLGDSDPKTRRNAILALRRFASPEVERDLLPMWPEASVEHQRSLAATLGTIGSDASLARLRAVQSDDAELTRIVGRAVQMLERTLQRDSVGRVRGDRSAATELEIEVRCREGLELLCGGELDGFRPRKRGPGVLRATLSGPLDGVFRARTMLGFGFVLPTEPVLPGMDAGDALATALGRPLARAIVETFTEGRASYRIEWVGAGHRRAAVWRAAERARATAPWLLNDPTESVWQAVVREGPRGVDVTLEPRKLTDPRFAWRRGDVPAASHPTVAAAIARVAGANPTDVVWDPFVGSGMELVERGLLGPFARLVGTDRDGAALAVARDNLTAAGVANFELMQGDAMRLDLPGVNLILTNPPLGHRVGFGTDVTEMLLRFLSRASRMLARRGRMVWLSPDGEATAREGRRLGLTVAMRQWVDLGGLTVELQRFERRDR